MVFWQEGISFQGKQGSSHPSLSLSLSLSFCPPCLPSSMRAQHGGCQGACAPGRGRGKRWRRRPGGPPRDAFRRGAEARAPQASASGGHAARRAARLPDSLRRPRSAPPRGAPEAAAPSSTVEGFALAVPSREIRPLPPQSARLRGPGRIRDASIGFERSLATLGPQRRGEVQARRSIELAELVALPVSVRFYAVTAAMLCEDAAAGSAISFSSTRSKSLRRRSRARPRSG